MRGLLVGFIIGVILLPLIAFCYVYFGYAPVATAAPPFPMERKITSLALKARISKEAPKDAAIPVNEDNLMAGARVYRQQCAVCHGMAGEPETPTSKGMFPHPPQLLKGRGVTNDPPGVTFWKVKNGIRLTGMPAYGLSLSEDQLWQVSLFLANANKLPGDVSAYLIKTQ
jgi:mono/diheme cytochrome c family protein